MACILDDGKLTLSGDIGDLWFDDHFTHEDVVLALAQIDDDAPLTVYLNSGGGVAYEGAAIHALLSRRSGVTDVVIDGVAASAASLIAMAGDTVTMSAGSVLMIHDPAMITVGNSDEHGRTIEMLEALATSYARVYAGKSGKTVDECRAIMKAERWYAPEEAVTEGFADRTSNDKAKPVAAFDYRAYAHAPKRLVALASKKDWRLPDAMKGGPSAAATRQSKETAMSDDKRGGDTTAELERLRSENATLKAAQSNDESAKRDAELEALRAEKKARENADAIMALDEAKDRSPQAKALADAGVTVAQAKVILAASGKNEPESQDDRRLNGQGLGVGSPTSRKPGEGFSLTAQMKKTLKRENA